MHADVMETTGALLIATLLSSLRGFARGVAAAAAGSGGGTKPTIMPAQTAAAEIARSPLSMLVLTAFVVDRIAPEQNERRSTQIVC